MPGRPCVENYKCFVNLELGFQELTLPSGNSGSGQLRSRMCCMPQLKPLPNAKQRSPGKSSAFCSSLAISLQVARRPVGPGIAVDCHSEFAKTDMEGNEASAQACQWQGMV